MKKYNNYIENTVNSLTVLANKNNNIFITGKNMTGKSDILAKYVKKNRESVFFIDTINRTIVKDSAISLANEKLDIGTSSEVNDKRINEDYINKLDVFAPGLHGFGAKFAYNLLFYYFDEIESKLELLLDTFNVKIVKENKKFVFYIDKDKVNPSSGYQALLRIFIEIYYFSKKYNIRTFVIDELDSHLDNFTNRNLLKKFNSIFPDIQIIATVHSLTFFEEIPNCKIIILDGETYTYKLLDSNDIAGFDFINREIFNSYKEEDPLYSKLQEIYLKLIEHIPLLEEDFKFILSCRPTDSEEKILLDTIRSHNSYIENLERD